MLPSASLPVFSVLSVVLAFTVTAVSPAIAAPAEPPVLAQAPSPDDGAAAKRRQQMSAVRNWGYWLSSFEVSGVAAAPHELMVIDNEISADRSFEREFTPAEVARMKRRPDGSSRVLLAYLSISEAERYRRYWQQEWYDATKKPDWLGRENHRWVGNFAVEYWRPEWQRLIFGAPDSYLDRIMAQGFDGVYLDRADAFLDWQRLHPSARAEMAAFVARLSDYARERNPQFLIVMQNAEELLEDARVLDAIDGIAKEDLLYGVRRAEEANKPDDVTWSVELLQAAQRAGRRVLVVEYLKDPEKIAAAGKRILEEGFVPYFAPRRLNCLNPPVVPTEAPPDHLCR